MLSQPSVQLYIYEKKFKMCIMTEFARPEIGPVRLTARLSPITNNF